MGVGTINSLIRHRDAVVLKHKTLDKSIKEAYSKRIGDIQLHRMKKEKLSLKEEIVAINNQIAERAE
jgi:uncharacterized protein YdcH (DUF465 family)|tara:strand:+ start:1365 stop:1565 length:201 start_codon:yes stop_codon:yes gene_type:complete